MDPTIYLALDNCFAIKRWVEPKSWMPLIKSIGFNYVEASFDNEIDFLYSPKWYLDEWFENLEKAEKENGVKVSHFFTGYQTYRTAGLGHPNAKMAEHLLADWLGKALDYLGPRQQNIGFSFHALPEELLQNPEKYHEVSARINQYLAQLAQKAARGAGISLCVEAMYAPHQPPWTIRGTENFLREIYAIGHDKIYTTIDLGHMIGQARFLRPSVQKIEESLKAAGPEAKEPGFWLGGIESELLWKKALRSGQKMQEAALEISKSMDAYSYMFSDGLEDSDPYAWLEKLACYSPIMHLQQTNGLSATHAAFTEAENAKGIIEPQRVLRAIAKSYENEVDASMPPKANELYLSFEIFAANAEYRFDIVEKLCQTARYWRKFVPEDGMKLSEIIKGFEKNK